MKNEEVAKELELLFIAQFRGSNSQRLATLCRGTAPWDSLKHIELISAIEMKFSIRFSFTDAMNANTLTDIQQIVVRLLSSRI